MLRGEHEAPPIRSTCGDFLSEVSSEVELGVGMELFSWMFSRLSPENSLGILGVVVTPPPPPPASNTFE